MSDINIVLENRDDIRVAVEEKDINVEVPVGKDGRSLRPRGEWSASAAYAYLDLVSYQGSSYVALKAVPAGTLPTDTSYWMLSAEKGEPGTPVWGAITGDLSDQTDLQTALDAKADVIISSASGSIASFTDGSPAPVTALTVSIEPVQSGTGDPSPENVRPISGHSTATVTRTGKNLLDTSDKLESRYINDGNIGRVISYTNSTATDVYRKVAWVKKGQTYKLSYTNEAYLSANSRKGVVCDENNIILENFTSWLSSATTLSITPSYDGWIYIGVDKNTTNLQLELGSTATAYEAPQIQTVTIDLDGTRYGAMIDVLAGTMTVTDEYIASYNGETLPSTWISDRDVYAPGTTPTTGAQVVYKLASPQTVQLTPSQMQTLLGQNVLWADTGDVAVTYRADTKLYIDSKFSQLQALILEN